MTTTATKTMATKMMKNDDCENGAKKSEMQSCQCENRKVTYTEKMSMRGQKLVNLTLRVTVCLGGWQRESVSVERMCMNPHVSAIVQVSA